jgi:hypothetical protein
MHVLELRLRGGVASTVITRSEVSKRRRVEGN